jgi:succinate-semialdehyde dehydrogenase/glutarate-semialdehyde dehydrogenase
MYSDVSLFIDGEWRVGSDGKSEPIINPATGKPLARLAHASH